MNANLIPFEQGRSFASQFTARRMNDIQNRIPRIKFVGGGVRVSNLGNQVFVQVPKTRFATVAQSFPWNLKNTSTGSTGQVQLNGGDEFVAQLNAFICNVNGSPSDTPLSGPPNVYPQLSITGNGYVYAYAVPTTPGTATPLTSLDLFYEGSPQSQDTANPAGFYWMLVATITGYASVGGKVSFLTNRTYGPAFGPSSLVYCGGVFSPPY